jgi:hypothetical protein
MKYRVVTTYPADASYAKDFLDSFAKHWDCEIYVYYEGRKPSFKDPKFKFFRLADDRERKDFLARNKDRQKPESDPGNAYRWDWDRFCHKVFALTNPRNTKDVDYLIWLDADVMTLDTVDAAFLAEICKGDVAYVGRDEYTHPDCAFVAYGLGDGGNAILYALRDTYVNDTLFSFSEWHDSHVFRELIKASEDTEFQAVNLSPGIPGMQVFDDCVLGTKMRHLKGPLRKAGLPVPGGAYASQAEVPVSGMRSIEIKTKNCVPHENIQANIHYNVTLVDKWVKPCRTNDKYIIFCSGGPSLEDYFDQIKKAAEGNVVVCVKHAHDRLIEAGIVPDFCVLLDPRNHVQNFIDNPHPDVTYMISSMVHPSTTDQLLKHNAKVVGYHAHVGAEEDKVLADRGLTGAMLIGGGCSAAMRGISVFYTLGFHRFKLFGYDLCYSKKPFRGKKSPVKDDGVPKFIEITTAGKRFWTDPEKVAQAQDFEKMIKENKTRIELEAYGPGVIPHMWAAAYEPLPDFEDLIG